MRLNSDFYTLPAVSAAPLLLGKILCRQWNGQNLRYRITETEAYAGENDSACHARFGKTPRNSVMYEPGGKAYIYLCYGIHYLLNIVTSWENEPEAVLIRGIEGFNGPGKLTKELHIHRTLNGLDLTVSDELWIEDDGIQFDYIKTPRIGIGYAREEDRARLWRFVAPRNASR